MVKSIRNFLIVIFSLLTLGLLLVSGFTPGISSLWAILPLVFLTFAALSVVSQDRTVIEEVSAVKIKEVIPLASASLVSEPVKEPLQNYGGLSSQLSRLEMVLPVADRLKELVIKDTEKAVTELTHDVFSLTAASKNVGNHIETCLVHVIQGEGGLVQVATQIGDKIKVLETLAGHFDLLNHTLDDDLKSLRQTVESINEFSSGISDLADQTNVLAINASIEAARVGMHGKGFAVIAGQVQVLAKMSKDIADKMAHMVRDVVEAVDRSFEAQSKKIAEADLLILNSEKDLRSLTEKLLPLTQEAGKAVSETQSLSEEVTKNISSITVSLQFQDRIRQVLEHTSLMLRDSVKDLKMEGHKVLPESLEKKEELKKNVMASVSQYFTIHEEWSTIDVDPQTLKNKKGSTVELF